MSDVAVAGPLSSAVRGRQRARPAEDEDDVDPQDLASFRAWLRLQPHLPHDISDYMLGMFLHSQNHSLEMAKMTLDRSYSIRTAASELFSGRNPLGAEIQDALDVVTFAPLPRTTPEGYRAFLVGFRNSDPSRFAFVDSVKLALMVVDLVQLWDGRVPGYRLIMDMRGAQMAHVAKINLMTMKRGLDYQQEGLPVRLKGVHVINAIPLLNQILALMKPCMKPETRELIHVHTEAQVNKFYEYVPQDLMPREYGGQAPPVDELHALVRGGLEQHEDWFKDEEKLRVEESRRPAKSTPYQHNDVFGCNGSFKKLALD